MILDFNQAFTAKQLETYLGRDRGEPIKVETVRDGLAANAAHFVAYLFPSAIFSRTQARIGNTDGDPGGSLLIETAGSKAGIWKDFGDPSQKGGDLLALYQANRRVSFHVALQECAEWLGQGTRPEVVYSRQQLLAKAKKFEQDLGPQKGEWHYTDAEGSIIASVYRFEPEGGGKEYLPWDAVKRRYGNPDIRPLYNIPGILQSDTVIFCEGEKAAKSLIDRGVCATSVMGGSNSPLDKSDLSPLSRKDVLIWPDADGPGLHFASQLSTFLKDVCSSVSVLTLPETVPSGWDAADATEGEVKALLGGETAPAAPVLPFFWFSDAEPSLEANDFVEGLLTSSAMSVVYGPSNCGKTFFILDLALHVAWGREWRGRAVDQGAILYLSLEGALGIRNRIAAFKRHHGLNGTSLPFVVMPRPINLLDNEADVRAVIQLVQHVEEATSLPVRMVIIDTLSRAMAGGNENSPEDMTALIGNCDQIRSQTGAHVSVVHHSGKDEARGARGHSSLRAATDTEIEIKRDPALTRSSVRIAKQRDLEAGDPFEFTLHSVYLGDNARKKPVTSCVVLEAAETAIVARQPSELSPKEAEALSCLWEVLNLFGYETDGVSVHVSLDHWKTRLRGNGTIDRNNDDMARTQFNRIKKALDAKGKINISGDAVCIAETSET